MVIYCCLFVCFVLQREQWDMKRNECKSVMETEPPLPPAVLKTALLATTTLFDNILTVVTVAPTHIKNSKVQLQFATLGKTEKEKRLKNNNVI